MVFRDTFFFRFSEIHIAFACALEKLFFFLLPSFLFDFFSPENHRQLEVSDSNWEFAGGKHIAGFWALNKKARRAISRHFQEDIFGYMTML